MEIGCGAGNTMFPLLNESKNPKLFVYACDFSSTAVKVVQTHKLYDEKRGKAFVWDLASDDIPPEVEPESMDVLVLIFVFSALHPDKWDQAVNNLYKVTISSLVRRRTLNWKTTDKKLTWTNNHFYVQ